MTGRGFMVWADGRRYDGEWFENRCNGRGVLTYKDGRRYEVQLGATQQPPKPPRSPLPCANDPHPSPSCGAEPAR